MLLCHDKICLLISFKEFHLYITPLIMHFIPFNVFFTLIDDQTVLGLFCFALLCVHSSFAIILKRKRKLVALLYCLTDVL